VRVRNGRITFSATDVANHLSCAYLTKLDLRLARGEIAEPAWENPHLVILQQRGLEHEKAYIESLRTRGLSVLDLSDEPEAASQEMTRTAMESGAQVIYQGVPCQRRVARPHRRSVEGRSSRSHESLRCVVLRSCGLQAGK
jgi:hypothetical protein